MEKAVRVCCGPGAVRKEVSAGAGASRFRGAFCACLTARRGGLSAWVEVVLCADGAVKVLVDVTLVPGQCCGHGALYGAHDHGGTDVGRLRVAADE